MNILPRKYLKIKPPKCAGCLYSSMTRKPWTTNRKQKRRHIKLTKELGMCLSIDQMESTTPDFIGQTKGMLTKLKYRAATIFVDHASRFTYVHLQKDMTSESTVEAKQAFELDAKQHGIRIQQYHADNGRFADNLFMKHAREQGQRVSFCGVNAHFQNGIAERKIRDQQIGTRRLLLHAKANWNSAVDEILWPYALFHYNNLCNSISDQLDRSSKIEQYSQVEVANNIKTFHTWGCPVYVLNEALQGMRKINKWKARSRVGIYLGNSPRHARSVSLVLNVSTGHVLSQYHVQHDDFFETVKGSNANMNEGRWKSLTGSKSTVQEAQKEDELYSFSPDFETTGMDINVRNPRPCADDMRKTTTTTHEKNDSF